MHKNLKNLQATRRAKPKAESRTRPTEGP